MIEAGVFQEDERLELVDGEIVVRAPIGERHVFGVRKLIRVLQRMGKRTLLDIHTPLGISQDNDFYPDVALLSTVSRKFGDVF